MTHAYKKLCTLFYNISQPQARFDETNFYKQRLTGSHRILEAMCGSGRLLLPLLKDGFTIDGVDNSPDMLESCRQRCAAEHLLPNLFLQDITRLELPYTYDAIIIPLASFQLITDQEQALDILGKFYTCLNADGILIIDTFAPDNTFPLKETIMRTVTCSDGSSITLTSHLEKDAQHQIYTSHNYYQHSQNTTMLSSEEEHLNIIWYTEEQMRRILTLAGFLDIETGNPFINDPYVTMYIANKRYP